MFRGIPTKTFSVFCSASKALPVVVVGIATPSGARERQVYTDDTTGSTYCGLSSIRPTRKFVVVGRVGGNFAGIKCGRGTRIL